MRVLAVCDQRYAVATREVVGRGAGMITSPPVFAGDWLPGWLGAGWDFIYVDLHGQPGSVYLYSGPNQAQAALSVRMVRGADLRGAVVFAATCYLPSTPFLDAFLGSGALAVVAGRGENWGTRRRLSGAQILAKYLLEGLRAEMELGTAFRWAKQRLRRKVTAWLTSPKATADALRFEIWRTPVGE